MQTPVCVCMCVCVLQTADAVRSRALELVSLLSHLYAFSQLDAPTPEKDAGVRHTHRPMLRHQYTDTHRHMLNAPTPEKNADEHTAHTYTHIHMYRRTLDAPRPEKDAGADSKHTRTHG